MTEGQFLFTLDYGQFTKSWSQEILFKLQQEFDTKTNFSLSQSLLISQETTDYWLLVDFDNQKTYDIKSENSTTVEVSEGVDLAKRTDILSNAGSIVPRLQEGIGTHSGIIDALKRLNFTIDLENLKRADLSARKLSFEAVYPGLEVAYEMLQEILAAPRSALVTLPSECVQQLKNYVLESYEVTRKIIDFGVGGNENIRVRHGKISQEIYQFCENVKKDLLQAASYLSSKRVEQLEDRINSVLASVEERYNMTISDETDKLLKIGEKAQQQTAKIVQNLEETYQKYQNRLTEKPISQYKAIFNSQGKKHAKTASTWLKVTVGLAVAFGVLFSLLLKDFGPAASQTNQLSAILPNLFAKGFSLSLIILLLNRSIKNYAAEKHLEVINTHRQNALETFDAFADAAAGNRDTRDQVLLAATKAIFDPNQSGYLSTKTSSSDSTSPVQQIIKEVLPSKSSDKSD